MKIPRLAAAGTLAALIFTEIFSLAAANNSLLHRQDVAPIALSSEPHHHLALENEYVRLYQVEVSPGDSVRLHRHDTDAISVSLSDSQVTVESPGKPDAQQKLTTGQIRLQALGYVHSTLVQGDAPFRNVTVELLLPQTGKQNLCAQVMAAQPLHCEEPPAQGGASVGQPQFESQQTSVNLVRVPPHGRARLGGAARSALIVAIDGGAIYQRASSEKTRLGSGDFVWLDNGTDPNVFQNDGEAEVRLILFAFKAR